MSSDARTLPLRDDPIGRPATGRWLERMGGRGRILTGTGAVEWVGALSLLAIVAGSVLIVVIAADRPSIVAPITHASFYPSWMAGPLGGLWPGLTRNATTLRYLFSGAIAGMYVSYVVALLRAPAISVRFAVAAIAIVHAAFLLAPPLALTDVFNYINYGRMEVVHHLNPYTTIPILEPHGDPSYSLSNWHQLLSPYGPLFTLMTFAVVPLGVAGSFWALKVFLAATSLGTLLLIWRCARILGRDPVRAILFVGLNPIVLVWGLGGDHNDSVMVFAIVLGFYLLLLAGAGADRGEQAPRSDGVVAAGPLTAGAPAGGGELQPGRGGSLRTIGAGGAFMTAVAIKASAGVLIPVVLAGLIARPRRLLQVGLGMAAAGVVVGLASLVAFGAHVPDLNTQSRLVTLLSVPNLLGFALGNGGETGSLRVVLSVVLAGSVAGCCVYAWRRGTSLAACGWASVALLLTLSWVLPWYVLWVLPLAALSGSRRLRIAAVAVGAYLILAWAPASGQLWNAIGFHPEKTPLGRLHQRYVRELLN